MTSRHSDTAGTARLCGEEPGKTVDSHKAVVQWWMTAVLISIGFIMVITHPVASFPL